jgi:hypothetical protein
VLNAPFGFYEENLQVQAEAQSASMTKRPKHVMPTQARAASAQLTGPSSSSHDDRMILWAANGGKWLLRGMGRLIHPSPWKVDSPKSVYGMVQSSTLGNRHTSGQEVGSREN